MATGTYVGDGVAGRNIIGLGFRPDAVLVKVDYNDGVTPANAYAVMRTFTMPVGNSKPLPGSFTLSPNMIQSLDSDGFTLGNHPSVNLGPGAGNCGTGTCTYYWTAFRANADVKVGFYTGNGLAAGAPQAVTGVGFSPDYVITLGAAAPRGPPHPPRGRLEPPLQLSRPAARLHHLARHRRLHRGAQRLHLGQPEPQRRDLPLPGLERGAGQDAARVVHRRRQ